MGKHYIREWRKKRGMTLQELCDKMEISEGIPMVSLSHLAKIERNAQPYTQRILEAAAKALGVTPGALLGIAPNNHDDVAFEIYQAVAEAPPEVQFTALNVVRAVVEKDKNDA